MRIEILTRKPSSGWLKQSDQGKTVVHLFNISMETRGHLALEIKVGVGWVCVCVCIPFKTVFVHLPHPAWAGRASLIHIPQIIEGHRRRAEASLDPPEQTPVNSCSQTHKDQNAEVGVSGAHSENLHLFSPDRKKSPRRRVKCENNVKAEWPLLPSYHSRSLWWWCPLCTHPLHHQPPSTHTIVFAWRWY